nr:hypothetical protein [Kibdelosporangium sp. MJ126-NF4]CEL21014.1 hypothetical protein [Kibdelosporangium sp. MJ126-NF4]CTQ95472.1 hypothetical protein [Kibdelosporangium sp. MJ126-NF4]
MLPDHEDMLPAARGRVWDLILHALLFVVSVVVLYFGFLGAVMAGGAPQILAWTLAPPVVGALIAIAWWRGIALATHGAVIAVNLVLILIVANLSTH